MPTRINWMLVAVVAFVICYMIYLAMAPHYPVPRGYIFR